MTDKEKIKEEIERLLKENKHNQHNDSIEESLDKASKCRLLYELKKFIDSLPEEHKKQPKFKVGDMVISTNNPSLTYKVLQVGLPNELGNLDYEVEIFTNGKPGIKVGNTLIEHNIHIIGCDRMDEWGKLIPEEPASEDLEEEMIRWHKEHFGNKRDWEKTSGEYLTRKSQLDIAYHFAEWQKQKDQETIELAEDHAMFAGMEKMREEMMKDAVECTWGSQATSSFVSNYPNIECGDKVKIIIVKV